MDSVKLAAGMGTHGPQMLYPRPQPGAHPGPQVIPQTTRSYDGQYKGAISPPLGPNISTSRAYSSYPMLDGRHGGPRYMQQPTYLPYHRDPSYSTPITDRPAILHPPHQRRPSIMGNYGGYTKDMVHVLNTSNLSMASPAEPYKRIKLSQPARYSPLVIDTNDNHSSRENPYCPQVEAISPTLPPDPRDESPVQSGSSFDLIKQLEDVDKDIAQTDASVNNLKKKEKDLEAAAQKGESQSQEDDEDSKESKNQCTAQIIYADNRKLAIESHTSLNILIPQSEINRVLPLYHQPSDCLVYQQNKEKFIIFKQTLLENLKRLSEEKQANYQKLISIYSNKMTIWSRNVDKIENSKKHKEKVARSRELFEKVFPELRKQREDKERFSRVGARVKSDAEMEEIMDGLQEQENEDKKMRAYAVIPPIMLGENERKYRFINNNGSIENSFEEYKQNKYVNIWTEQECDIFKEKYLQHPKNFVIIASYLEKKSVSDAVHHYYVTKKKENYKTLVKRRMRRPRAKNQTPMDMHLNTRVRTRGAAAKDIKSEPVDDIKQENEAINGAEEGMWHSDQPPMNNMQTEEIPANLETIANSTELTEKDKENLNNTDQNNIIPKNEIKQEIKAEIKQEGKREEMDTSEEENTGPSVPHDCFVCKNRVEHFGLSRRLKPAQAANYGLNPALIPPEARVCTNCNCRSVRRSRICLVPTCAAPKRKVKRLKSLPSRWSTLSPSIKEPIVKELQLPNDLTKCCLYCYNRILNKIGPEVTEPVDISKWSNEDIEKFKSILSEVGCNWSKISDKLNGKTDRECKAFYNSFKENYKLDVILSQYKKSKGKSSPPTVTDEEESGSSSSSCEETEITQPAYPPPQVRHDSASDTLSASSPPPVNCVEDSKEQVVKERGAREDYDSSATTLSADEVVERDSPPEIEHIPHPGEKKRAQFSQNQDGGEVFQDIISQTINATLSGRAIDKVKAPQNSDITMESILQKPYSYDQDEGGLDLTVKKRERSPDRLQSHPSLNHRSDMQTLSVRGGAQVTLTGKDCHPPMAHSNSISYLPTSTYNNAQDFPKSPIYVEQQQRSTPQTTANSTGVSSPLMIYSSHRGQPVKPYKQMAPPISVTVSSPSYSMIQGPVNQSPRRIAKVDKTGSIPGSIIRGTPVNQPPHHPSSMHSSRYDLVTKSAVSSGGGSITQGTPILQEKKSTSTLHLKDNIIESRGGVEIISRPPPQDVPPRDYRQRVASMNSASISPAYSFTSYPNYSNRPSFSDSKKIIEADYITSIHMMPSTRPDKNLILSRQRDPSPSPHSQRSYPERRPDTIIDRRPSKEVDMRPIERPVDKKKVQIMKSSGIVPVNNYYPNNPHRTASPLRDAPPNPPSSENHEYRSMNTYLAHPRHNSVIQNSNKMSAASIERYSPHSVISTGAEYHRNPKLTESSSLMVGNSHQRPITMYEHRPSSRDKTMEGKPSYSEHIRLADESDKIAITYMDKGVPKSRNSSDNLAAQTLLDKIINDNIKGRRGPPTLEELSRYRREGDGHNYIVSETEKRGRSPYSKKEEIVTLKDTSHRSHKEGHGPSLQMPHHVNLIKTSQPHMEVISRDYAINDPKKTNHHSYTTRPPIEITRFDVRQQVPSDHKLHPVKYSVESEKDLYDTRSPHRPTSSRMVEEERRIIRIPQPQSNPQTNAFSYIANKLQTMFREESPEKDKRQASLHSSYQRSQGPHQSSQHHSSQQSQIPHGQSSQMSQQIRSNSHFDDELSVKKRPRLEFPPEMNRPPSRPRSGETKDKLQHKDEVDSPQSGEMVIDENPKDDRAHDEKRKFQGYGYGGFSQTWSAASSKNGRFQGYEPSVEPVSDDE